MRNYIEFGKELYVEHGEARPYNIRDLSMAHMHTGYELLLVLDKVPYSTVINGKIVGGIGPMAMIVAPYCMHFTYYIDSSVTDKWFSAFYVGESFLDSFSEDIVPLKKLIGNDQAAIFDLNGHESEVKEMLDPIIAIYRKTMAVKGHYYKNTDMKQRLLFGVIVNMLYEMSKSEAVKTVTSNESYIYDVVMYIVKNLDKNLTTPEIAANFFVSRDKLNRDFKQYTQMTVRDFVTESRMNLAKSKLSDTKYTVSEISRMCGFENEIYFYSFFKKNMGITPRQYAEKMKK